MPTAFEKIKNILTELKPFLMERYKVKNIGIFGSYVRGEQKKRSDLDILVDFDEPISLLKFIELENYLRENIGLKVDLVMKDSLKPRIGSHIIKEVVNI
ncbi:MAG: nucleotidyltransferase family protein [Deltaproteobacteria bacterium]|nr:nucleotidyltransferase family protein [Deltaproteobacteria bacterium]